LHSNGRRTYKRATQLYEKLAQLYEKIKDWNNAAVYNLKAAPSYSIILIALFL